MKITNLSKKSGTTRHAALCALALLAIATESQSLEAPACSQILEDTDRLKCYDALFPPHTQQAKSNPDDEFGLSAAEILNRKRGTNSDKSESISAKIIGLQLYPNGERLVTLNNQQTWLITEKTQRGYMTIGDTIKIRKGALGTYLLIAPDRMSLRSKRLR